MSWKKVKLGDIADFSNGINFDKAAYSKGVKLVGVSNFGDRYFPDYDSLEEVNVDVVKEKDYLSSGDIIFVRSNGNKELVGRCMLIWNPPCKSTYSGFCIRARFKNADEHDPIFWTYHFKSSAFRKAMSGSSVGTNIQNLSQGRLSTYEAVVPDFDTQQAISRILSDYDALIQNHKQQIKLLEEAAQRLYKEWFVDLRFPGYENTQIVDGVPEGWSRDNIGNLISYEIGGGWGEEEITETCDNPAFVIRGTDLYGITHGNLREIPYRFHTASNLASRKLCDGDIVFEVSGGSKSEGVARTLLITSKMLEHYGKSVMCASFCKLVRPSNLNLSQYLYDAFVAMRKNGVTAEYDKKSASSIVNYRWKDFLTQQTILIPNGKIIEKYNHVAEATYELIVLKSIMIEQLKQARDRLLPKLMNGEFVHG